jgi:PAS domain-containing protein
VHPLSVFRFPIDNGQGGRSVVSIAIDVTERKRAEQRLLGRAEAKYRELIEQASDGIFVCDRTGRVLLANTRWCELVGYTPG